jgi:hypothetical protein
MLHGVSSKSSLPVLLSRLISLSLGSIGQAPHAALQMLLRLMTCSLLPAGLGSRPALRGLRHPLLGSLGWRPHARPLAPRPP